jgi:hypothetical protein
LREGGIASCAPLPHASLDRRRTGPVLLRNGVGPCRTEGLHRQPRFREFASLDAVGPHTCATARLAGLRVSPLERKAKPRAVAFERVIVHDDTYIRPLLPDLCDLRRVGLACYRPVATIIVPDEVFADAVRNQVIWTFVPNPLPAVE